jgi:hypothetical protein
VVIEETYCAHMGMEGQGSFSCLTTKTETGNKWKEKGLFSVSYEFNKGLFFPNLSQEVTGHEELWGGKVSSTGD